MVDVRWHFFDVRCKMTVKSSGADHKNLKSETTPLVSRIRGILSGAPNIVLGNFCCTDHSTGRDRSPSPHTGVFFELGKHADRRPFRRGFLVPLPPGERDRDYPGKWGKKGIGRGRKMNPGFLPPRIPPTPGSPRAPVCVDPRSRSVDPCPRGKNPALRTDVDVRKRPESLPGGSRNPPFRRER